MMHLKKICLSGSSDFPEFSLVTDVWQQRFPRFFAGDRRLAAAISSIFRCCQTSVNSVFLNKYKIAVVQLLILFTQEGTKVHCDMK